MHKIQSNVIRRLQTTAKYREVANGIRLMLRRGQLEPGQRVPPEKELAERFGVSYMTVRKANDELIRRGIIRREQGKGTFVMHLIGKRTQVKTVGFLAIGRNLEGPTLTHFQQVKNTVAEKGIDVLFDSVTPFVDAYIIPPQFSRDPVDAIIAYGVLDEWLLRHLSQQPIPVVVSGSAPSVPSIPMVQANDEMLAYRAAKTLLGIGYRQLWLVIEPLHLHVSRQAVAGYRRAIAEAGQSMELIVMCEDRHYESFVQNVQRGSRTLEGPHAVMWWNRCPFVDLKHVQGIAQGLGVVNSPRREGEWRLPTEIDLGCLTYPWHLLGQQTAVVLDELINNGTAGSVNLEPEILARGTERQRSLEVRWNVSEFMQQRERRHA